MRVPCKVCGEFDCVCKLLLAKAFIAVMKTSHNLVPYYHRELEIAVESVNQLEREV